MSEELNVYQRAVQRKLAKDPLWYKKMGAKGGSKGKADGVIKGFALDRERASAAGKIGGRVSRRRYYAEQ